MRSGVALRVRIQTVAGTVDVVAVTGEVVGVAVGCWGSTVVVSAWVDVLA